MKRYIQDRGKRGRTAKPKPYGCGIGCLICDPNEARRQMRHDRDAVSQLAFREQRHDLDFRRELDAEDAFNERCEIWPYHEAAAYFERWNIDPEHQAAVRRYMK